MGAIEVPWYQIPIRAVCSDLLYHIDVRITRLDAESVNVVYCFAGLIGGQGRIRDVPRSSTRLEDSQQDTESNKWWVAVTYTVHSYHNTPESDWASQQSKYDAVAEN